MFDLSIEDTRRAVDLNLFGTVIPTTVFGRVMAEQGKGSIVNVSSLTAQRPLTRVLGYPTARKPWKPTRNGWPWSWAYATAAVCA